MSIDAVPSHRDEPDIASLVGLADEQILEVMRDCHDRRLEREGIPMVLALADERGEIPPAAERERAEGARLARVLDHFRQTLTPWASDDDEGAVITAVQVLAVTHLAPAPETAPHGALIPTDPAEREQEAQA